MNRRTRFFQKHILNDRRLTPAEVKDKLFTDIFGFTRMRGDLRGRVIKIIEHVYAKQRTFNYRYYLNKNCPMPPKWHERKAQLLKDG